MAFSCFVIFLGLVLIWQYLQVPLAKAVPCCQRCNIWRSSKNPINVTVTITQRTDGYLDVYRGKKQCDWLLTAPTGYFIKLALILRYGEFWGETILAYDGASPNGSSKTIYLFGFYKTVTSSGRYIWLKNIKARYERGFTLEYTALKQEKESKCLAVKIQNGKVNCSNYTCHVTCDPEYFNFGSKVLKCVEGNQWAGLFPKCLSVRIVGSKNNSTGRVEVSVDGKWFTVSYRGWTIQSSNIVCRMLGLPNATAAPEGSIFPSTIRNAFIQVEQCTGDETSIFDCSVRLLPNRYYYNRNGYAGIICGIPKASVSLSSFVPNRTSVFGEVLLSVDGVIAHIGVNNWDKNAMNVVCRMLGIEGPHDASPLIKWSSSAKDLWIDHVRCLGNESSLLDCDNQGLRNKNRYSVASPRTAVAACGRQKSCSTLEIKNGNITCSNNTCHVTCRSGYFVCGSKMFTCVGGKPAGSIPKCCSVRIQGSRRNSTGRVEIFAYGIWGQVSYSRGWTIQSANVICRMLGHPSATAAPEGSIFPSTAAENKLMQVENCTGEEASIFDCRVRIMGEMQSSSSSGYAGIVCGQPKVEIIPWLPPLNQTLAIGKVLLSVDGVIAPIGINNWNKKTMNVVCRMLGIEGPHDASPLRSWIQGSIAKDLWIDHLRCLGNESSILDCDNHGLRNKNRYVLTSLRTAFTACGRLNLTFNLTDGMTRQEGLLDMHSYHVEGRLDLEEGSGDLLAIGNVICHLLGLPTAFYMTKHGKRYVDRSDEILALSRVHCHGNEQSVSDCNNTITINLRNHGYQPGLVCRQDFYCPPGCKCSGKHLEVSCIDANLAEVWKNIHILTYNLYLESNAITAADIDDHFLLRLPNLLTTLTIKGYRIQRLKRAYFFKLDLLTDLILHNNELKVIDPWFLSCGSFGTIEIHDNNITTIKTNAFTGIFSCNGISLVRNSIRSIAKGAFQNPKSLIIEGNNIVKIKQEHFYYWPKEEVKKRLSAYQQRSVLMWFDQKVSFLALPGNHIEDIEDAAFEKQANSLSIVLLQNNSITRIRRLAFQHLIYLHSLWLSFNPLEIIEDGAFYSTPNLRNLRLADTKLHTIVPARLIRRGLEPTGNLPEGIVIEIYRTRTVQHPSTFDCSTNHDFFTSRGYIYISSQYICYPCPYGTFKVGDICKECPAGGVYQDEQAQYKILAHGVGCKQCPVGSFVSQQNSPGVERADCQACPDGTRHHLPALFRACFCRDGHYRVHRFENCFPCARGYKCVNETISLLPGFYWKWNSTEAKHIYMNFSSQLQVTNQSYDRSLTQYNLGIPKAYACPTAAACKGGLDSECSIGYEGPLCAVCTKQFYSIASTCHKCPTIPWIVTQIILVIVIVLGLIVFMVKDKKNKSSGRSLSDIMTARLKILIGFYQVTSGTISSFSYVQWPDTMIRLVRYAEVLQMNLLQVAPLHCISESLKTNVHIKLLATVLFNIVAAMAGSIYYHIRMRKVKKRRCFMMDKCLLQQRCYRAVFLILFISFPITCSYIFQVLPETCQNVCTSTDEKFCKSFLKSDYSVDCSSRKFNIISVFSYILLVYPVGFPSLIFYLLWKYFYNGSRHVSCEETSPTEHHVVAEGLKFVYENYARNVWFWEIIELVRKVLLTSVILLSHSESRTYLGVTAIISGIYAVLFAHCKPITDTFEHWLQMTSLLATMVNMVVGMLLKIPSDSLSSSVDSNADEAVITAVLMMANVAVIAIMAVSYLVTFVRTVQVFRKNPQCSISCCLYFFLTINQAGSDLSGVDNNKDLNNFQDLNIAAENPELKLNSAGLSIELQENDNDKNATQESLI